MSKELNLKTFITKDDTQICVSTVDLGVKYIEYAGYETMVFDAYENKIFNFIENSPYTQRYKTLDEAIKGHYETIKQLLEED